MGFATRVLDTETVWSFDDYVAIGGGSGLSVAAELDQRDVIELVAASGLRGRGGAGFPTGLKWRTVAASALGSEPITVVINAAEGEPGTFKDRELMRRNPYRILEGALIAAYAMGAPTVIIGTKASFRHELERLEAAIAELHDAGIASDVAIRIVQGPDEYLFGEETALLQVIDGEQPFPRVAPPYRRGLAPNHHTPVLVDNVETIANVANILAAGPDWFREVGTKSSPGTVVCTISGDTQRHGVAEVEMGTPVREVIDAVGGGPFEGRDLIAAIAGTANSLITADQFDTPMSYEAMSAIGSGLGTGGLIVFDDTRDLVGIAEAVSHFLAVESCGQCEPCKLDGREIAANLEQLLANVADESTLRALRAGVNSVGRGARCALARQQESVVGDILVRCQSELAQRVGTSANGYQPVFIAPIVDLVDGRFQLDETYRTKQPDWTHGEVDSGESPADRFADAPVSVERGASAQQPPPAQPTPPSRDPFAPLMAMHETLRQDLDAVLCGPSETRADAAAKLETDLRTHIDVTDRIVYPMLRRVVAVGDDSVWVAENRAFDAISISDCLSGVTTDSADHPALLDQLAKDVRRQIAEDERVVFPLLRQHLDADEQTDLADAVDEVLAAIET